MSQLTGYVRLAFIMILNQCNKITKFNKLFIWAFLHAFHCIFLSEKEKKDAASIVNAIKMAHYLFLTAHKVISFSLKITSLLNLSVASKNESLTGKSIFVS